MYTLLIKPPFMTYIDRDIKTIGKHVNNAIEEELRGIPTGAKFATVQNVACRGWTRTH